MLMLVTGDHLAQCKKIEQTYWKSILLIIGEMQSQISDVQGMVSKLERQFVQEVKSLRSTNDDLYKNRNLSNKNKFIAQWKKKFKNY